MIVCSTSRMGIWCNPVMLLLGKIDSAWNTRTVENLLWKTTKLASILHSLCCAIIIYHLFISCFSYCAWHLDLDRVFSKICCIFEKFHCQTRRWQVWTCGDQLTGSAVCRFLNVELNKARNLYLYQTKRWNWNSFTQPHDEVRAKTRKSWLSEGFSTLYRAMSADFRCYQQWHER